MTADTSERGLERLICTALAGHPCEPPSAKAVVEPPTGYGGVGWSGGSYLDYDREHCVDLVQLAAFLHDTQPETAEALALDEAGPTRSKFLARLQGEIAKRGTVEVLRHGIRHGPHDLDLFYGTPSPGNEQARDRFERNRFTVTRQFRYSRDETQWALDIALFINGLPVVTFELKNNLTRQTVDDAVRQYRKYRNPREKLFELGRCVAHFAVDEAEVRFCTHLRGKASWFLPFNRGWNDGAGNPSNPSGIKTDYLWREVLTRVSLTHILENYAQVVESRDERTGRKTRTQVWPRYHQLDVVRRLLADAAAHGAGRRYLVQHSAGSGKSNSIAWLAHQLIGLRLGLAKDGLGLAKDGAPVFDSVIKARKKLRRFVEGHDHAIHLKAEIMADHFLAQVLAQNRIGGEARAMVVTNGIERAIQYFHAIRDYLAERKSRHRAIVAFSGEHELGGAKVSEASLNGFPSGRIAGKFREEPYRFLVCADKFQTGYDEPLLHTMYVDKTLAGIQAVQTLSRLNRAHPKKHDVFVLDFLNDAETIPARVAKDTAFRNAHRNSDRENARIEHDRALLRMMTSMMKDDNQLFKQFMDNDGFKRWMTDTVFELTSEQADAARATAAEGSGILTVG